MTDGFVPPMLAVTGDEHEDLSGFAFEFKWDGIRAIVRAGSGRVTIWSRRGNDVTRRYPELAGMADALPPDTVVDGEVVAFDAAARPSFSRLQQRMNVEDEGRAAVMARTVPVAFLAFDLLELRGSGLTAEAYEQRRDALEALGFKGPGWQVPPAGNEDLGLMLATVDDLGLEGVVAKRLGSPYRPGVRSPDWRKIRRMQRDEFVVGGYRAGAGRRQGSFGSLLLGYHDPSGALRFAGSVGSGFSDRELARLEPLLSRARRDTSPFADPVPHRDAVYVEPLLVAEVRYSEFTPDGVLRQPSYKGLREDKSPAEVVRADPPGRDDAASR